VVESLDVEEATTGGSEGAGFDVDIEGDTIPKIVLLLETTITDPLAELTPVALPDVIILLA